MRVLAARQRVVVVGVNHQCDEGDVPWTCSQTKGQPVSVLACLPGTRYLSRYSLRVLYADLG